MVNPTVMAIPEHVVDFLRIPKESGTKTSMRFLHLNKLWNLGLPPKVHFFCWMLANNCLASKDNLVDRGMFLPNCCDVCSGYEENLLHFLRDCYWSRQVWEGLDLASVVSIGVDLVSWLNGCFLFLVHGSKDYIQNGG
ncbi:hypothetical protein ACFE04_021445 [Oxalis oulophora]